MERTSYYDVSIAQVSFWASTTIQFSALLLIGVLTLLGVRFDHQTLFSFGIAPVCFLGLLYNFLFYGRLAKSRPVVAGYFCSFFVYIEILIFIYSQGGFQSNYFALWPILLIVSGMFGIVGVMSSLLLSLSYFGVEALAKGSAAVFAPDNMQLVIAVLVGGIFAYFIAMRQTQLLRAVGIAKNLSGELSSAQNKERLMLTAIADAVVGVDTIGRVILFNTAAEQISGWDAKSAQGIYYNNIFKLKDNHDKDISPATDPFLHAMKSGRYLRTDDFYMLNKNNEKISFSISIAPTYDSNHASTGAVAVFHDISEQKAVQRERNEFVSTASHEMRTPVAAIEGFLSMATNPQLATIDDRAKSFIEKAHQSSLHLGRLFQDLLSVTKIEDKHLNEKRQIFNINDLVKQICTEMEVIAAKKKLKLSAAYAQANGSKEKVLAPIVNVEADPERLREVISNLIDNAIKYTPQGQIDVQVISNENFVTVSVKDTGMGISIEDQKHLFEKFYRANNSMTREIGGTGLGLFIARNLIEHYGGRIWVESRPGQGATFSFSLPIKKQT